MQKYLLKRLFTLIPTLFGITVVCFFVINMAPGGPLEKRLLELQFTGAVQTDSAVFEELTLSLKKQYGFDKPVHVRYGMWLKSIFKLDFGESFVYEEPAIQVIISKFPVSLQFGIISLILTYLVCITLGIAKAVKEDSRFDAVSSLILLIMYSIPPLVLGILLKTYLTGGGVMDLFPVGDLYSDSYFEKGFFGKILDRMHHFVLPLICYMAGHFTVLTFLTKNSLVEEVRLDYVRTAKAKGLDDKAVVYKHALRNALIPVTATLGSFLTLFFAGSLIIEKLFSLDGIGLLGYTSVINRDYHVLMALIFFQSFLGLAGRLISDLTYTLVDPRIDFS